MVLGFKPQFKEPILKKKKKHTIRKDENDRWKPGMKIHFATGVRTKLYHQFYEGFCKSTQRIIILYDNIQRIGNVVNVSIDGRSISWKELETLAINDGFESVSEFLNWFDKDFKGKIIHWTDLRY